MRPLTIIGAASLLVGVAPLALGQQFIEQTGSLLPMQIEYSNQLTSVDIEGDGDLDIVVANGRGYILQAAALPVRVYVNRIDEADARFVDETAARAPGVLGWFRGVEAGDCDGDGDWDLILAQDFNQQPRLLINDGSGFFADETSARLPALPMSSARAQFGDVDNDGDLDLFFCNSGPVNRFGSGQPRLLLNDGAGGFSNVTSSHLPPGNIADQQDCIFGDVDGDLDLDLHVGSRAGTSRLWLNDGGGVFSNSPVPGGGTSYSSDFGDIDGDGDLDLLYIEGAVDALLENGMPGSWTNISAEISPNLAIDDNDSKFLDFDNDGDLDYVVGSLGLAERVYRNNGGSAADPGELFTQLTSGIMPVVGDATLDIEVADYDGDGKLDIFTAQGEKGNFQNRIYINGPSGPADTIAPAIVAVEQVSDAVGFAGPFAVRAMIHDGHTSDRGFYPGPILLTFGFRGETTSVEMSWYGNSIWRAEIPAMAGACGTVEYHVSASDRAGNMAVSMIRSFSLGGPPPGDLDGDCSVDGADLGTLLSAWGSPGGPADLNGDGTVDGADLGELLSQFGGGG